MAALSDQPPYYAFNGVITRPRMPAVGETVNGQPFAVPRGARTMTIHWTTNSAGATYALQTLSPTLAAGGAETWSTLRVLTHDAAGTADTSYAVDALVEQAATVLGSDKFGAGVLRLVSASDESATPFNIPIVFGF